MLKQERMRTGSSDEEEGGIVQCGGEEVALFIYRRINDTTVPSGWSSRRGALDDFLILQFSYLCSQEASTKTQHHR